MNTYFWHDFDAAATGISGQALNASANMSPIPIQGADLVVLWLTITNATGAALDLTATLQERYLNTLNAGTYGSWMPMQIRSIAGGVETWHDRSLAKTTAAAAATYVYRLPFDGLSGDQFRLASLVTTTGGATDLISITARVRIPKS